MTLLLRWLLVSGMLGFLILALWHERRSAPGGEAAVLLTEAHMVAHRATSSVEVGGSSPHQAAIPFSLPRSAGSGGQAAASGVAGYHLERVIISPISDLLPKQVQVADISGDQRNDVIELLDNWTEVWLRIHVQQPDGQLRVAHEFVVPGYNDQSGLGLVDLDGNGVPEIIVGTAFGITVFQAREGTFTRQFHEGNLWAVYLDGIDANGDGFVDVVAQSSQEGAEVFLGNGRGGISGIMRFETEPFGYNTQEVADFTADGHPDLIQTNGQGWSKVWIHPTLPRMGLQPPIVIDLPADQVSPPTGLTVADMDRDGWPDLVVADVGRQGPKGIRIFYGSAIRDFQRRAFMPMDGTYEWPGAVAVADLDGNGWPDVVAMHNSNDELSYFLQGPDGFADHVIVKTDDNLWTNNHYFDNSMVIADVNSDRCPDVVLAEMSSSLRVFYGRGCKVRWPTVSRPLPPLRR